MEKLIAFGIVTVFAIIMGYIGKFIPERKEEIEKSMPPVKKQTDYGKKGRTGN